MKRSDITSNSFRADLARAHRAKADAARGATLRIFAKTKAGKLRAKPFDNKLRTQEEAERQVAYWSNLNPHLTFEIV